MKKVFLIKFLLFVLLFSSCGKKQENIIFHRNSAIDSTGNVSGQKEYTQKETFSENDNQLKISPEEAKNNIGTNAIVKGYVADVVIREKVAYLNFDKKYPKNTFTAVIFADKFDELEDLNIYKNQNVEVKGVISEYKEKPQIIISSKNQINIVK